MKMYERARSLFFIIATVFAFYLLYTAFLFIIQRQMMYPRAYMAATVNEPPKIEGLEEIWISVSDWQIETWYLPAKRSSETEKAPLVIFAHGNGERNKDWVYYLKYLTEMGVGLLMVEYPGYGRSEGKPSQENITKTMVSAYDTIIQKSEIDKKKIILMGRSLGGGAVCQLAKERPAAAMILLSTFTSAKSLARRYLVPTFLLYDHYDNLEVVSKFQGPIALFHGDKDSLVPYKHSKILLQAAPNGQLFTYPTRHNDFPHDWEVFWSDISGFLKGAGLLQKAF